MHSDPKVASSHAKISKEYICQLYFFKTKDKEKYLNLKCIINRDTKMWVWEFSIKDELES